MIKRIDEMIENYNRLNVDYILGKDYISLGETLLDILSDLEELKKIAEKRI